MVYSHVIIFTVTLIKKNQLFPVLSKSFCQHMDQSSQLLTILVPNQETLFAGVGFITISTVFHLYNGDQLSESNNWY